MRASFKGLVALASAAVLSVSSAGAAVADVVYNDVDGSIDASVETKDVTLGGTGTVVLAINPANGDGKNGCNLTASSTATFSVTSSNTGVATVSPSSVTFASCGETKTLTVSGVAAGDATVSLAQTANTTGATFDIAPATFLVHVTSPCPTVAPAAPTVDVTPAAAGTGWYNIATGAPTATITPASATPATTQQFSLDGGAFTDGSSVPVTTDGVHTLSARSVIPASGSCAQVDGAATAPITLRVDRTAPTYTVSVPAATGSAGWDTSSVTVSYSCSDATSGLAAACPTNETYTDGQTAAQVTTSILDVAGNPSVNQTRRAIMVDTTAPTVTSDISGPTGSNGWDTAPFSIHYTCGDTSTGVASGVVDCPVDESFTQSGSPYAARDVVVHDAAGNTSATYARRAVTVDSTDPFGGVVVTPSENGYGWNNSTVTATYTCTDAGGSAVNNSTCPPDETFSTDGITAAQTFTVQDNAGNAAVPATRREVKVDLSAPQVTVSYEDAGGNPLSTTGGWYTEVVHVRFTCTDNAVNGVAAGLQTGTAYACPADYEVNTEGITPASPYEVRDQADNATTGSVAQIKLDTIAPTLAVVVTPSTANGFGWNNAAVTVDWTCSETGSGLTAPCFDDENLGDGSDVAARNGVTVSDAAGHLSNAVDVRAIKVDTQAPTISTRLTDASDTVISPTSGWFNQTVWVRFTCSDNGTSGLRDSGTPYACPPDYALAEGHHDGYLAEIKDKADNGASDAVPAVDIDTTAPTAVTHYYAAGTTTDVTPNSHGWFNQDVDVHVVCTDPVANGVASGVAGGTCPADVTRSEGTYAASTFTVSDVAGNSVGGTVAALNIDESDPTVAHVLRNTATSAVISPNGNGWFNVPVTVDFTCNDTGGSGVDDTSEAVHPCPADLNLLDGVHAAHTVYVDDKAGNQGSDVVEIIRIDTAKPVITLDHVSPRTADVSGTDWWKDGLVATFVASDAGSGLAPGVVTPFSRDSAGEGAAITVGSATAGSVVDVAGNVADDITTGGYHIDGSAAIASASITSVPAYTDGGNVWYKDVVNLAFTASDPVLTDGAPGSGLASASSGVDSRTSSGSFNVTATDNVGHATTSNTVHFLVDASAPTVALSCPAAGTTIHLGDSLSIPWSASDVGSGLAGPVTGTVSLDTSSVGGTSAQVAAGATSDNVGHASLPSNVCAYSVTYNWHGFFQPIDSAPNNSNGKDSAFVNGSVYNKVKAGSTVPVKFDLSGDQGLGIMASGYPKSIQVACTGSATVDAVEETTSNPSGLKYDATANQYIYSWKTSSTGWAGTCRELEVKLADGTSHYAFFQFTK